MEGLPSFVSSGLEKSVTSYSANRAACLHGPRQLQSGVSKFVGVALRTCIQKSSLQPVTCGEACREVTRQLRAARRLIPSR